MPCQTTAGPESDAGHRAPSLRGGWLAIGPAALLALAAICLSLFVAAIPARIAQPPAPPPGELWDNFVFAGALAFGFTARAYSAFTVACDAFAALAYCGIAALIVRRKSAERGPLLVAALLVLVGTTGTKTFALAAPLPAPLAGVDTSDGVLAFLLLLGLFFPDGRFVPRWVAASWLIIVPLCVWVLNWPIAGTPVGRALPWLVPFVENLGWATGMSLMVGLPVYAQIHRYRRVSGPRERQQTTWALLGFAGAVLIYAGVVCSWWPIGPWEEADGRALFVEATLMRLAWLLIPLAIGVAILRSRLYDIDLLINRALVYGLLTATLGAVYGAGVAALGSAFGALTGGSGGLQLAVVGSTLAVAALFQPLRRRIQSVIDRRFYRRKYDAIQTLAAFGARLRSETDLERLGDDLLRTTEATMQPAHASLWLRPPHQGDSGG